jgi:hypothetical protein
MAAQATTVNSVERNLGWSQTKKASILDILIPCILCILWFILYEETPALPHTVEYEKACAGSQSGAVGRRIVIRRKR